MVIATLYVVLLPGIEAPKVEITVIAWPVGIGILFVLLQCPVTLEPPFTAITIRHLMVVVQSKRGWRRKLDIRTYLHKTATWVSRMTHVGSCREWHKGQTINHLQFPVALGIISWRINCRNWMSTAFVHLALIHISVYVTTDVFLRKWQIECFLSSTREIQ